MIDLRIRYDIPTKTEMDAGHAIINSKLDVVDAVVDDVQHELSHRSYIFPDDIDKTVTFVAGAVNFAWSDWTEVADNLGGTFSSKLNSDGHVSGFKVRNESAADVRYLVELGYGDSTEAVTTWDTHEFISGTNQRSGDEQVLFRPLRIPGGKKVYYRMKCETGGATCTIVLRYHLHKE